MALASTQAMALDSGIPQICKSAANYAAKAANISMEDGTYSEAYDPAKITFKKDFVKFPITKVEFVGNCDETPNIPENWCRVAGGSPDVWKVEVSQRDADTGSAYPIADVVVTYNRGGCHVDEVEKK